ncbi:SDR family NAD(P)-dependent oxidoreductase [Thermocoleostomius sinensis]|uniref:SDR family oxidoreductase n=1 Tax=Thermocoleostomius sinensis A174 TaxID=2016057 RepID=A0A9E9C8R6_9CYAN|nr:SDR family oxidoreductase [Thermocoleostomius sinensis]WAL58727.1 SDR family oxidoreductase [Thermocoleostomius sinensis A174]
MSSSIAEQVILITGASAGIGAALAELLAARFPGIRLILTARSQDKLETLATRCRQAGAEVLVVVADLTQSEQVSTLTQTALDRFGRVDVLVNNAGYGQMGPIELISDAAVQQQFKVNLLAPIALIRSLIPVMRSQGGGRIINISSIAGRTAFPLGGLYSASKFALEGLSDALRMELEPFNISVSVIEPGPVRTDFFGVARTSVEQAVSDPSQTPYRAAFGKLQGLEQQVDRQAWTPEQVAEVVLKAISARRPKPRYVAATGGKFAVWMMTKVLPTRLVDVFWQRFYGIDLIAKDWRNLKSQ